MRPFVSVALVAFAILVFIHIQANSKQCCSSFIEATYMHIIDFSSWANDFCKKY